MRMSEGKNQQLPITALIDQEARDSYAKLEQREQRLDDILERRTGEFNPQSKPEPQPGDQE